MNTREIVKLSSDTGYIPVKYAVIEVSVGSALSSSYVWIKCISYGVATSDDFSALKQSIDDCTTPDMTKLAGSLGSYSVTSLDKIAEYSAPASYDCAMFRIG